ncbi:MAG: prolyl oligopeptidase family serine peptidase, partial [Acidobacteriota bacterium]|nr:prolyl oligopeptidase family serine peptidase [Acidobacteriota bacterium]
MTLEYQFKEPEVTSNKKPPLLLLLHGIGADENDLYGIHPFLDKRFFVVSARAPYALPYGGYGWFEIYIEPGRVSINGPQFEESRTKILRFVDELISAHDVDAERIYLCGFSQGAMMSLSALFSEPEKFAGVIAMSGRAVSELAPTGSQTEKLKGFPILVTHGTNDPVLPI